MSDRAAPSPAAFDAVEIRTREALEAWLAANDAFDHAETVSLRREGRTLTLVLLQVLWSTLEAGSTRTVREVTLIAEGSTAPDAIDFAAGVCTDGLDLGAEGLSFRIDIPAPIEIVCEALRIEVGPARDERVRPWLSDRSVWATIPGMGVPPAGHWIAAFAAQGVPVCWRYLGSEGRAAPHDPLDYEGWYLQRPERVGATTGGLFFSVCRSLGGALSLSWDFDGDVALSAAAKRVLASFDGAEVHCGNCRFEPAEWRDFVASGVLPIRLQP